jgi:hypothetical protein
MRTGAGDKKTLSVEISGVDWFEAVAEHSASGTNLPKKS